MIQLQGEMFIFMLAGYILRKKGMLPKETKEVLTEMILNVVLPCNILLSFCIEFDGKILKNLIMVFVIATIIQGISWLVAGFAYKKQDSAQRKPLQYATVCSNAGFLGTAIVQEVFGMTGVLYASIYLIPQRIFTWSIGLSFFTKSTRKKDMIKQVLTNPCMIAVYIGIFFMIFKIKLPTVANQSLKAASACLTPLSMILIGAILSELEHFREMFQWKLLRYSVIRLIILPLIVWGGCQICGIHGVVAGTAILLSGMPAASATSYLAAKFHSNYIFATECVVFSTVASFFTIPFWCVICMI